MKPWFTHDCKHARKNFRKKRDCSKIVSRDIHKDYLHYKERLCHKKKLTKMQCLEQKLRKTLLIQG